MTDWRYVESECPACEAGEVDVDINAPGATGCWKPCPDCKGTGKVGVLVAAGAVTHGQAADVLGSHRVDLWVEMGASADATAAWKPRGCQPGDYTDRLWRRDSKPCEACTETPERAALGPANAHSRQTAKRKLCKVCGGAGRTLVVDCDACNGHGKVTQYGDGFATCEPCKGLGSFVVIGYRQATKLETRRECRGCPGDGLRNEIGAHCLHCNDKGYIDAEPGELWIAAEVLR